MGRCLLLLSFLSALLHAQTSVPVGELADLLARGRQLLREERFLPAEQIFHEALKRDPVNVEAIFLLGLALAKQQKWEASKEQLERATARQPSFVPAHVELAGVQFKLGHLPDSIRILRTVLSLDPDHQYAQQFLATLLYLKEQRIEALHYWNRTDAPRIGKIAYRVPPKTDPKLVQHLFPLNEGELLRRQQVLDIRWKQERFHLGSPFYWHLIAGEGELWDLELALTHPVTLPFPQAFLLENSARALLYRQVAVQYPRTARGGTQLFASFRWDPHQKRVRTFAEFPFLSSSSDNLRLGFDLRDETWKHTPSASEFLFQTEQVFVDYEYLMRGRKSLSVRGGYEHRFFRPQNLSDGPHFLRLGLEWNQVVSLNHADTAQFHWTTRLDTLSGISGEKQQARQISSAAKFGWQLDTPSRAGIQLAFRAGLSSRHLPVVDYFIFGVGQDQPLPLRAHPTVESGRKGHGPMARNYALANFEIHRRLLRWRFAEIGGLAFSDSALVSGDPFEAPAPGWFQDAGCGLRLRALGQDLVEILFGFDLRTSSFNYWIGLPTPL